MPPSFDRDRFEALVLYIAHRRRDDERFGRTKLAKVLFYADFNVYRDSGEPLTGATYQRMPFGPFPRELEETERELERRHEVILDYVKDTYEEKRIIPLRGPPPTLLAGFEEWQVLAVDTWIDRVASATARDISRLSHHHPGWLMAGEVGVEIPYETALLPQDRPTGQEAEEAKDIAREQGWLSDRGWVWERSPS
jgi:hypothetical protein